MNANDYLSQSFSNGGFLVLNEDDLDEEFFDLSTGVAGELMQKFVNYNQQLAIIVRDPMRYSSFFQDLKNEHRNHPCIRFVGDESEANTFVGQN